MNRAPLLQTVLQGECAMPARDARADLTLRETAVALGLSMGSVGASVKAGKPKASGRTRFAIP